MKWQFSGEKPQHLRAQVVRSGALRVWHWSSFVSFASSFVATSAPPPVNLLSLSRVYLPRALAVMSVPTSRGGLGNSPGRSCYRPLGDLAYNPFVERQWQTTGLSRVDEFRKGRFWSMPSRERTPSPSVAEDLE